MSSSNRRGICGGFEWILEVLSKIMLPPRWVSTAPNPYPEKGATVF